MDNTDTKINSETKTQKDNLSANNLRDPNIILPQSRRNMKPVKAPGPINMQAKTDPVMLRSFNKDISEAMAKKKSSVSIKDVKIPKVPEAPKTFSPIKTPTASDDSLREPALSTDPEKAYMVQKTAGKNKIKTKPIPSAPIPESVAVKKEGVRTNKIVAAKLDDKSLKKEENFSSEIFPKPPQFSQTGEQKFIKKVALSQQKSDIADQDIRKDQKLCDDFDRMIHGEYDNNQEISQVKQTKELSKITIKKIPSQQEEKIKKEVKPVLSKAVINIHISTDDLKKLKEDILDINAEEKELGSKLQDLTKEEITLTEEENREEADKNLARNTAALIVLMN